jgi:hypothetical protein
LSAEPTKNSAPATGLPSGPRTIPLIFGALETTVTVRGRGGEKYRTTCTVATAPPPTASVPMMIAAAIFVFVCCCHESCS